MIEYSISKCAAECCSWYACQKGCHLEGCCQAWQIGPWKLHEIQSGQVQGPATRSGHSLIPAHAKQWMDLEQPCEEGSRNSGEQDAWMPVRTHCLDASKQCVLEARRPNISWAASKAVWPSRVRQGIIPLHSALWRPQPECSIWVWRPQHKNVTDLLHLLQPWGWPQNTFPVKKG